MPLDEKRLGSFRKTLNFPNRNFSKNKPATMMIALIALATAIAFSVSVESRTAGWLWKTKPSVPTAPSKNGTAPSSVNAHQPLGPNAVMLAPVAPTVTASKTDALITDVDMDGKADPGDTLKYTVSIGVSGMDATAVQFNDTVDPNTAFVAGTLRTTPIARNDGYTATGNIRITVAAPGVLGNDSDADPAVNALTATAGTFLSTQGGNVNLSADGSFTYNPPAGFEGNDTFTYTLNDNDGEGATDTGTVSITVSGMIWFINNNFGGTSDGRLTNPFKTLADFQAVNDGVGNHPAANDNIFVYESATDYVGPVTLLNGQKFIGQDATATLASIAGITLAPGSDPLPTTSPGAPIVNITSLGIGITVGQNNTLRGFTGGNAVTDIEGTSIGTLNVSDVTLNGNGRTLNLTTGTLNGSFGSLSSTNSATTGMSLTSIGGSLSTGSTTVSNSTGIGINVNTSSLTLSFANTSVTGSGGAGVSLTTNTGAITFGDLDISPDAGQRGLLATDNTQTITTTSGTIGTTTGTAVEITRASSTTPLAIVLTSVSSNGAPNGIMLRNTSGSFSVVGDGTNTSVGGNSTGGTIANATGADGATSGTGVYADNVQNLTLRRMTINGTNQNFGIRGNTVNNFTLEYATVNGTNGTNPALAPPEGAGEGAVYFGNTTTTGMTGTGTITNCIISGGRSRTFSLINSSGSLNRLTITGTTFGLVQNFLDAQRVFSVEGRPSVGGTVLNTTVTGSSFAGSPGDVVNFTGQEPSTTTSVAMDVVFQNNAVTNTHAFNTISGGGMKLANFSGMTFNVSNNSFQDADGSALTLQLGAPVGGSTIATNLSGTINNNTIGVTGVPDSGSKSGNGIFLSFADNTTAPKGQVTLAITNNTIRNWHGNFGISADNTGGNYDLNATITGNTVLDPSATSFSGLGLAAGAPSSADDIDICAAITGNDFSASSPMSVDIDVFIGVSGSNSSIRLPSYLGTNLSNVQTFVQNNQLNAGTTSVFAYDDNGNGTTAPSFLGGAACSTPTTGPITPSSSLSAESVNTQLRTALDESQSTLFASRGENSDSQNVLKLTSSEASAMLQAAIARWADAGLSASNLARLQSVSVEIADLPNGQLATVSSSKITLDETAAGYGWFFDTTPSDDNEFDVPVLDKERQTTETSAAEGRMDLLTVLMRQLGSQISRGKSPLQGAPGWLMEGAIDTGTRRAPAFKLREVGKVTTAPDAKLARRAPATTHTAKRDEQLASAKAPRSSRVMRNHAMRAAAPMSFADVMLSFGDIPAGKTVTVTWNVTVDDPFPGPGAQVCNQGTVSGTNFTSVLTDDPAVGGLTDPTCTPIDLQADLEVTKTDSPDPVIAGNNITYTINFKNNGPNAAGATVTDATPAGTTFVSASVTSGTGWGTSNPAVGGTGNVVFSKALVAVNETAVFEIVVKVNSSVAGGSTINNSATAATTGATDPVPGNNTGNASTSVIAQADLSITKTDGATTEIPGTPVSYTITVSNSGPSDANGVSVADTFPGILTGVTFTSVAAGGATGNTAAGAGNISDTVNMPAGSSITYTVNATIQSSATGNLTNTATVTAPMGVTDPDTNNNSATDTDTLVPTADLSITKTDGATSEVPGTSVTYTITVTNNGPSDAPATAVADTFPGILTGVTFTSVAAGGASGNTAAGSGDISDMLSMPAGSSVTYTVNATVNAAATGNLTNTATVTEGAGVTDPNQANNSATDTDTLTPQADLSITKTDGSATEVPGTPVTYTITVTNNGPSDAPGTSVADMFPGILTGVSYTSVAAGGATGNTAAGAGNINDVLNMPAGSSVTYTVTANIQSSATGNLSNTATVTAGGGVTDPTPGNNSATDTDTLEPSADVAVDKSGPATITPGNNITYTIVVDNNGPSDAVSLSLSDAVPTGTTFVSVTTPSGWTRTDAVPVGGTGTITFTAASLAAAGQSTFTLVVNANPGLADATIISNTVNVSSTTADPNAGNNTDTVNTTVQNNADLAIAKSVAPTGPNGAGASVTYTIVVINNGPSPANSVTFTDTVPAGLVVNMQNNPAGWSCNSVVGGNGTITCTKASMASGETAQLTVVATINCGQANGSTINNTATVGAVSPADNNAANNTAMASFTVNNPAPVLMASIAAPQLPQNSHELLNVGLYASATDGPCGPPTVSVEVYGDEDDQTPTADNELFSPDAKDIGPNGTLRLRAERVASGDGRVYLIVVKATDEAGQTSFQTFTVVVPKSSSAANVASVTAQAAAAKAYADANNGAAPVGYFVIGDGPVIGNKQ